MQRILTVLAAMAALVMSSVIAFAVDCPVHVVPGPSVVATCPDTGMSNADLEKSLALSAAASMPVWLGDAEKGRISGGMTVSEHGETAIGATGVFRINKNWAGFVGGAIASDGDAKLGRAGVSVGERHHVDPLGPDVAQRHCVQHSAQPPAPATRSCRNSLPRTHRVVG